MAACLGHGLTRYAPNDKFIKPPKSSTDQKNNMASIDIKVPNIGDFAEVSVIELLVKAGDTVKPEQSLITVESDKASMEIPSSHAGVVKELKVKLGDKVKEGSLVLVLESDSVQPESTSVRAEHVEVPSTLRPAQDGPSSGRTDEQAERASVASTPAPATSQIKATPMPTASNFTGTVDLDCDLLEIGAGPGGYSAAFRAADLGLKVILVER